MRKSTKVVLVIGLAYLVGIATLFVVGEGIAAAYLTMPGGVGVFQMVDLVVPRSSALEAVVLSWTGNLLALLVSAALNVVGLYVVVRLLSKS